MADPKADQEESDNELENNTSNFIFSKKLLKKFILLYKDLPCLWDRNNQWYKSKAMRRAAITKLTDLVREQDPTTTKVHILRKIESIRACIRRERKRVKDSYLIASSVDEVYKPHLWYYDLMSFVFEDAPEGFHFADAQQSAHKLFQECDDETDRTGVEDFDQSADRYSDYSLATSMVEVADSPRLCDDLNMSNSNHVRGNKRHCTEVDDEYDAIGVNVAAKLRSLPPNMRILSEKLINDVLFQAQVNGLTSATTISTPDPFK